MEQTYVATREEFAQAARVCVTSRNVDYAGKLLFVREFSRKKKAKQPVDFPADNPREK